MPSIDPHLNATTRPLLQRLTSSRTIGIICALLAAQLTAVMLVFIHNSKGQFSAADALTYRSFTFIIIAMPFCWRHMSLLLRIEARFVWLRGVFACGALFLFFFAAQKAPIALVSVIFAATPLLVYLLAKLFLKEALSPRHLVGCVLVAAGIALMTFTPDATSMTAGIVLVCLASMVLRAASFVTLRAGSRTMPTMMVILALSICTLTFGTVMGADWPHLIGHLFDINLLGIGLSSALMQWLLTMAYQRLSAGEAALIDQTEVVWAVLFGIMFHAYLPTALEWIAGTIVLAAVLWVQWPAWRRPG